MMGEEEGRERERRMRNSGLVSFHLRLSFESQSLLLVTQCIVQWNLQTRDTMGPTILSLVERLEGREGERGTRERERNSGLVYSVLTKFRVTILLVVGYPVHSTYRP